MKLREIKKCGSKLRRHVRRVGDRKMVAAWGCTSRILHGRATCDSHHVNEDTLQRTYMEAIRTMIYDADSIMEAIRESAGLVFEPENHEALDVVANKIIEIQQAVLELHKAKLGVGVTESEYNERINAYSEEMKQQEARQKELQSIETRYSAVSAWLTAFAEHIESGVS